MYCSTVAQPYVQVITRNWMRAEKLPWYQHMFFSSKPGEVKKLIPDHSDCALLKPLQKWDVLLTTCESLVFESFRGSRFSEDYKVNARALFFWFRLQRAEGISVPVSIVILRIHSFVGWRSITVDNFTEVFNVLCYVFDVSVTHRFLHWRYLSTKWRCCCQVP